jgi:hypothetical protein
MAPAVTLSRSPLPVRLMVLLRRGFVQRPKHRPSSAHRSRKRHTKRSPHVSSCDISLRCKTLYFVRTCRRGSRMLRRSSVSCKDTGIKSQPVLRPGKKGSRQLWEERTSGVVSRLRQPDGCAGQQSYLAASGAAAGRCERAGCCGARRGGEGGSGYS